MGKKRKVLCKEFNTCKINHETKNDKKKHDREYHSTNSAIGSREGYYNVVIDRDFSKTPPYYYCTGDGCQTKTNRLPSMKEHIPRCKHIQWKVAASTRESTLASPQSVPKATQPPSNRHQPTRKTKRKANDMASSAQSSAFPPADLDMSTSLLQSVSPVASQTTVSQSLTTQLELYMKSTDSALFNSQTALEQSHIAFQHSTVALQQITTSIAALEGKIDDFLTTTNAYRADINAKWENLTDQLAFQATKQLTIQDAVVRADVGSSLAIAKMLRDIKMDLARKNDDAVARNNDVLGAISQQRADSQETTRRLDGMTLTRVPPSVDFSEFGKLNVQGCNRLPLLHILFASLTPFVLRFYHFSQRFYSFFSSWSYLWKLGEAFQWHRWWLKSDLSGGREAPIQKNEVYEILSHFGQLFIALFRLTPVNINRLNQPARWWRTHSTKPSCHGSSPKRGVLQSNGNRSSDIQEMTLDMKEQDIFPVRKNIPPCHEKK